MYIFLDIDGVFVKEDRPGADSNITVDLDEIPIFEPECIDLFAEVVNRYAQAKLVISSSWREIFDLATIRSRFPDSIRHRVEGVTPMFSAIFPETWRDSTEFFRYYEVLQYLKSANAVDEPWLAIDDIREHYPPGTPMIVTDCYEGFIYADAVELERFLANCMQP